MYWCILPIIIIFYSAKTLNTPFMERYNPLVTSNGGNRDSIGEGSNIDIDMGMDVSTGMDMGMGMSNNMVQDRVAYQGAA